MGESHTVRDHSVDGSVDLVAVQHSVEQLMVGFGPVQGDRTPAPLTNGLSALIAAAIAILDVDRVGVMLLDEHGKLRSVASSDPLASTVELGQELAGVGPGVDTMRIRATVTVSDLLADDRYGQLAGLIEEPAARAVVSAPIWVNGALAGNFNAISAHVRSWQRSEIAAVETYAQVVATLLHLNVTAIRHQGTGH